MNISNPVSSEIRTVHFGFLSTEDILAISVKRIVNPTTFDSNGIPLDGGLHDSALGPFDRSIACSTCNLSNEICPGHVGHIELPTPIFHPIFFNQMYHILRSTCVYCHHLRLSKSEVHLYMCKLRLLDAGLLQACQEIDHLDIGTDRLASNAGKDFAEAATISEGNDEEGTQDLETLRRRRTRFVNLHLRKTSKIGSSSPGQITAIAQLRRTVVRDFLKAISANRKCNSCNGISPTYRKDGISKIFQRPLSTKEQTKMTLLGLKVHNNLMRRGVSEVNRRKRGHDFDEKENVPTEPRPTIDKEPVLSEDEEELHISTFEESEDPRSGRIMTPMEVYERLFELFENEKDILSLIYRKTHGKLSQERYKAENISAIFFLKAILVPPTSFRAPSRTGNDLNEHMQNTVLKKILDSCIRIRDLADTSRSIKDRQKDFDKSVREFINLQDHVNSFIDSSKTSGAFGARPAAALIGIKQILEKKEGLFRMNMMGKRVNFAARSVISPDPNIETNEIGVPLVFAKKLTYPEPVTPHNVDSMRQAVTNGPDIWPGAAFIEYENGRLQRLPQSIESRKALANQLLTPSEATLKSYNKKVYRHVRNGDMVIMNRQPTLHKPSMMGHKVRVLQRENTIRMHYANCNTYNADFDGDEMNMHLPQNENARAEAQFIANTDSQYLVPTSGKPLRGLIQDHIVMAVHMTNRDTLFTRGEYQELLYACLRPEDRSGISERISLIFPAVLKPVKRWTGKQVITTILENIQPLGATAISFHSKAKVPGTSWANGSEEGDVVVYNGYFVSGVLDKSQVGASAYGIVHSVHELYGPTVAGSFLSILGRLFTKFLHMRAFSCGVEDLVFTSEGDKVRCRELMSATSAGEAVSTEFVEIKEEESRDNPSLLASRLEEVLRNSSKHETLDRLMGAKGHELTSRVIKSSLPSALIKPFPRNQMQAMTISGAKGSDVNASQISCLLGQQVLEGRRVPVMISGKTLPSFAPFDSSLRAGGYVTGRFLTGIRPQEYYFHAMAGREGLIDTAVKTSRSGYLQRCLVKGMEGIKTHYDSSVRDSDGTMLQFLYGEDAVDIGKQAHLYDFAFHAENQQTYIDRLGASNLASGLDFDKATKYHKDVAKKLRKAGNKPVLVDPALCVFPPSRYVGSVSELFADKLNDYLNDRVASLDKKSSRIFRTLMHLKYLKSLISPGEAVGILAGQSIGEPSTQMTLNTFHLAGHAAKNVTLGIPRLREIVMTASAQIATPKMSLVLRDEVSDEQAQTFAKSISRLSLSEIVNKATVLEKVTKGRGYAQAKIYSIRLQFFPCTEYEEEYSTGPKEVLRTLQQSFIPKLCNDISKELKKMASTAVGTSDALPDIGAASKSTIDESLANMSSFHQDDDNDDGESDEDEGEDDAKQSMRRTEATVYDEPDDDEQDIVRDIQEIEDEDIAESELDVNRLNQISPLGEDVQQNEIQTQQESLRGRVQISKKEVKIAEEAIQLNFKEVSRFSFDRNNGEWCEIELEYPAASAKILMIGLVEAACRDSVIHHLPGIRNCEVVSDPDSKTKQRLLSADGVNFSAIWDYSHVVNMGQIYSNDIAAILRVYGVECARSTIIKEMDGVFRGHGISVDIRHLNLIADIMTRDGGYVPFNRMGLASALSPLLKMSFETTCNFLTQATLDGDFDNLEGPSARIVFGKLQKLGTGSFDILTRTVV